MGAVDFVHGRRGVSAAGLIGANAACLSSHAHPGPLSAPLSSAAALVFDCRWAQMPRPMHLVFAEQNCLAVPHVAHMGFGLVVTLVFCFMVLAMVSKA
jgi:hypothetical protein